MKTKELLLSEMIPYDNNPRVNDHAVDAVYWSIKLYGYKQPIVVDSHDVIIVGHTRRKALLRLESETGNALRYIVIIADDLDEKATAAYRLADNKVGEISDWSFPELAYELNVLRDDFDFTKLGWTQKELDVLLGEEKLDIAPIEDKIVISIGKDKLTLGLKDFQDWQAKMQAETGADLMTYLLDDLKLFPLKRRYELSK